MMIDQLITNTKVICYEGLQQVAVKNQVIQAIAPQIDREATTVLDLAGDWLSLGGVDLQINGGLGMAFPDLAIKDLPLLQKICDFLYAQGVDSFLPTIVTTSIDKIQRSLATVNQFMYSQPKVNTARILGVHLEGPCLNYQKRGAHPAQHLLPLTVDNLKQILGDYGHLVKVMTLAPELDPTSAAIDYLREQNIIVSLGHSLANAQSAQTAFTHGASMVTHAFNAMPGLHHREPGLLGAAIVDPNVFCGLIADGNHVCPTMLSVMLKASNYDQGIFLVSDALSPMGLPDGVYPWDEREITVTKGTARLADGTLSGTTLPLLVGVENLVKWGCDPGKAIAMATESPRAAIGLSGLKIGTPANFLRWHWHKTERHLSWSRLS